MRRTERQQGLRELRFDTAYDDWRSGKLTQEEAAPQPLSFRPRTHH